MTYKAHILIYSDVTHCRGVKCFSSTECARCVCVCAFGVNGYRWVFFIFLFFHLYAFAFTVSRHLQTAFKTTNYRICRLLRDPENPRSFFGQPKKQLRPSNSDRVNNCNRVRRLNLLYYSLRFPPEEIWNNYRKKNLKKRVYNSSLLL